MPSRVFALCAVGRVSADNWGDDGGPAVSSDTRIPPVFTIGSISSQAPVKMRGHVRAT